LENVVAVAAGAAQSFALLSNGTVMSWGSGWLGNGGGSSEVPERIRGLSGVVAIAAGQNDSLALLEDGTVMAWGENGVGQLGDGSEISSPVPVPVSGISGAVAIAAGSRFNMALLQNGTVVAWGANGSEQLGVPGLYQPEDCFANYEGCSHVPVAVGGLSGVRSIAAGGGHALALLENGTVMAWGENWRGQLGNGTESRSSAVSAPVSGLSGVRQIAANYEQSLALLDDGTVMAWGGNEHGQLGTGTLVNSPLPIPVSGLSEVAAVAAGGKQSLALLSNGTVMAWGDNEWGALGTEVGVLGVNPTPVMTQTCALSEVVGIAAGESDSFAVGAPGPACPLPPIVETVSPQYGPTNGETTVVIHGFELSEATAVRFGGVDATSFNVTGPESLTAVAPPGAGTVDVTVTGPNGTSLTRTSDLFTYLPPPVVTGVTPGHGPPYGVTSVTITGTGFTDVKAVNFGDSEAAGFKVNSPTSITVVAPQQTAGTTDVTVTNPAGTSATSPADQFSYVLTGPAPKVRSLSLRKGPAAGGTSVTITGTSFTEATSVQFGSTAASSFTVTSPTSITAVSPAQTPTEEPLNVRVLTPNGESPTTYNSRFTYEAPTITSVDPNIGPRTGDTEVTVTGTGFGTEPRFEFGKAIATDRGSCTFRSCTILVPASTRARTVHVRATQGGKTSKKTPGDEFTYQ